LSKLLISRYEIIDQRRKSYQGNLPPSGQHGESRHQGFGGPPQDKTCIGDRYDEAIENQTEGKRVALTIVRRHRLWEYFLVEKLQFDWDEVHELAEELEHVRSPLLIERLDTYLNRPKFDPHGDPIPDREGNFSKEDAVPLTILKANQKGKVSRITKNNKEVIDLIMLKHIRKGSRIEIKRIFTIDGSIELKVDNKYVEHISPLLAQNILIEHENGKK
jgi:DtxR family Mn-dependent transcriptional regulator